MAGSVNKLIIVGNLGADPEIRTMPGGAKVANLRVACTESWRDRATGERRERTEWISVVIFSEGIVKVAESYLRKGSKVYIEGQLQTRKWEKDGVDHYKTECVVQGFNSALVMLDGPQNEKPESQPQPRMSPDKSKRPATSFDDGDPDDIPF